MVKLEKNRIDKWLWSVRIYKTRQLASKACIGGKIKLSGLRIKPSKLIKKNDIINVKKGFVNYKYQVKNLLDKRIPAKIVENYINDITPDVELMKLKVSNDFKLKIREKGLGRPTKKDRRIIDKHKWNNLED